MKIGYYDSIEEFIKEIKNREQIDVIHSIDEKKVIINNQIIKYEEKKLGLRSFSKPYFIESQLLLTYEGKDKIIEEMLTKICNAYTDKEINAIIDTMPILKDYSEKRKGSLKNVAIIWRDHFLEENIGLLTSFVRMGVEPRNILAIDKGDSTLHRNEIWATFEKLGFQVDILDNTAVAEDELLEDGRKLVTEFIENRNDKDIVILDDGAIISKIITRHSFNNIKAFIELTVTGLKRIKNLNVKELPYPVLNVAKSKLKRIITYKEIASTIFVRNVELMGGEKLIGRTVIQLGYGDLGQTLAEKYRQYGSSLVVIEPDTLKRIEAAENGFITYKTLEDAMKYEKPVLIVGASGYNSISKEVVEKLENGTFITSGASADLSIFKEYEKNGCKYIEIPKYGTQYEINEKHITVLGNGRSVNLFDSEAIPNRSNDIFKASQLVVADKVINDNKYLTNTVDVETVDNWIDESKILELYYDLYFKRG